MRVLLDTNVLVAAFTTRGLCRDVLQIVLAEHQFLVAEMVLTELERVLEDKLRMPTHQVKEVIAFVSEYAEIVAPVAPATWPERDPDDQWVAAAALDGAADILVTGDKDLLDAAHGTRLRIVPPRGLWELLRSR
ncbi:MAG: putative toxin-antitoxin system toxin component, PIN family [Gammaproteobacteria bacterium]|nr:putative toxin-antitoxin system toxin component, PIN family [Gammaproteobacteria bacterium]